MTVLDGEDTDTDDVPVLPACTLSPPYTAVTITEFGEFIAGVYVTTQLPDKMVQDDGTNEPPTFPSFHDTIPVGILDELNEEDTATVNCTWDCGFIVTRFGMTVVVVAGSVLDDKTNVPRLVECEESPP